MKVKHYFVEYDENSKPIGWVETTDTSWLNENFVEVTKEEYIVSAKTNNVNINIESELNILKTKKINLTKQELAIYLQNNPLQFTDGKFYSVTAEKQTLLANAIQVYQMKVQAGLTAQLKWNATGEECTEWTLEQLSTLVLAIAEYVEPLVTHQQALEVQIRNATTLEELEGIEISYEMV